MRGTNVLGGEDTGLDVIAKPFEVADNPVQPSANERRNVFSDDEARPELSDDAGELAPEAGALAVEARSWAGEADVLAGETSANEIHGSQS